MYVENFMQERGYFGKNIPDLRAQLKKKKDNWWEFRAVDDKMRPEVEYMPGPDNHLFNF